MRSKRGESLLIVTIMRAPAWHLQVLTGGKNAQAPGLTATARAGWTFRVEHDLVRKPVSTFRDHARPMHTRDLITEKLRNAFAPESLHVEDESHRHAGHAGHRTGGETHFRLYIVSEAFRGKSRLERHRMINAALASAHIRR